MQRSALLLTLPALLLACGDGAPPTDVSGDYTIAITNESDTCGAPNFTVGETLTDVPFVVTQQDAHLTGTMGGVAGNYLDLWLEGHVFAGDVDGYAFELTLHGKPSTAVGNCTYTVNAVMDGGIDGDSISGDITYRPADNGNPDCGAVTSCSSVQSFSATRAPAQ